MSTCPERQLNEQSAEFVLQSIPVFTDLVDEHSVVPEKSFDDFFERSSDIDNAPKKNYWFQLNELTKVNDNQSS